MIAMISTCMTHLQDKVALCIVYSMGVGYCMHPVIVYVYIYKKILLFACTIQNDNVQCHYNYSPLWYFESNLH